MDSGIEHCPEGTGPPGDRGAPAAGRHTVPVIQATRPPRAAVTVAHPGPLPVGRHRALVDALAQPLPPVRRPVLPGLPSRDAAQPFAAGAVSPCLGAVLAEPVAARIPVPPFANSAMDGFAVRHRDIAAATEQQPVRLPVAGDIPAGETTPHVLAPGTAWRIMTGSAIPAGADTVVKVEHTDHRPGVAALPATVRFFIPPEPGANIRAAGEDLPTGALVLPAGRLLDGPALAAAVSAGHGELLVRPRPRVAIMTTGDELAAPGEPLLPGQIPDSNGVLLGGLICQAGADLVTAARIGDDPQTLRTALADCPQVDLVLTAGGISAGAYEVVRLALAGPGMRFHRVTQQPGGPQGAGLASVAGREVPVLCLPGNPVGVFVSFHVYAAGLIAVLAGRAETTEPVRQPVRAGQGWASPPAKTQFIPVARQPDGRVVPIHRLGSGSHLVASLPQADGLAIVPAGAGQVAPGDRLEFIPTRGAPQ